MKKKQTIFALILFVVLIVGAIIALKLLSPESVLGDKTITLVVNHYSGNNSQFLIDTDAEFVRGALEPGNYISGEESDYGLWVKTVDGETADETLQQWWGYTVNGIDAMYGVDEQIINDGDIVEFTLNEGY